MGSPPNWFFNPFNNKKHNCNQKHWSRIEDFSSYTGDIKCIWEASRFDWALILARTYKYSGDIKFFQCLNNWLTDWVLKNPTNTGPNWKCGQEASIRIITLLLVALILEQHEKPQQDLVIIIADHAKRIESTLFYSLAQNNNHGTSEAAALFIAGSWLNTLNLDSQIQKNALRWKKKRI